MRGEIVGVIQADDIECIHRMRVASRRLRNAMDIFQECFRKREHNTWMEVIKNVTRSLGAARDIDVQINLVQQIKKDCTEVQNQPGLRRLLLRLDQKRETLQKNVILCMGEIRNNVVLDEMYASLSKNIAEGGEQPLSSDLYHLSYKTIHQRLVDFCSYQDVIHLPDKKQELHNMRIAAKWLRYSLEVFSPLYSSGLKNPLNTCREAQEILGNIHDSDVWVSFLTEFMEKEKERTLKYYGYLRPFYRLRPGIEYFQENRLSVRDVLYKKFLGRWQKWQKVDVWGELNSTIKIPVIDSRDIYPPSEELSPKPNVDLDNVENK
jgi:CHAD domain-containing protein